MARDTLTQQHIVKAAIQLLDADGLEGLSMRTLGKRLGSAATAVYWHVGSKDNIISLAGDEVWGEVALPDVSSTGWRQSATIMATDLHAMLNRHLWLVQAFGSHFVYGPRKARHDDHALAVYEAAGFVGSNADEAATAVFIYVLGNALGPAAAASFRRKLGDQEGNAQDLMRQSVAKAREIAGKFPRLRARLDTAAADYAAAPEGTFEFGLEAMLDGLHLQLASRRSAQKKPQQR